MLTILTIPNLLFQSLYGYIEKKDVSLDGKTVHLSDSTTHMTKYEL